MTSIPNQQNKNEELPRIPPIENPDGLTLKIAYWLVKRQMGKVITPFKVIQSRMPNTITLSKKLVDIEDDLTLPDDLIFYIKSYVATLNGCSFCIDIAKAKAENKVEIEKYEQLLRYEASDVFSEAEKAALTYVEQATTDKEVSDEVFESLKMHFDEKQIVEITWLNAVENYYNLLNRPLNIGSDNLCRR